MVIILPTFLRKVKTSGLSLEEKRRWKGITLQQSLGYPQKWSNGNKKLNMASIQEGTVWSKFTDIFQFIH